MKFKRNSVIALYIAGKPQVTIVRALQHLNVENEQKNNGNNTRKDAKSKSQI